jgi:hypothetical protein
MRQCTFRLYKIRGISLLLEERLVSQEGLCSTECTRHYHTKFNDPGFLYKPKKKHENNQTTRLKIRTQHLPVPVKSLTGTATRSALCSVDIKLSHAMIAIAHITPLYYALTLRLASAERLQLITSERRSPNY